MPSSKQHRDGSQTEKFKRAAKDSGCDENERRWEERLKKVAKQRPEPHK